MRPTRRIRWESLAAPTEVEEPLALEAAAVRTFRDAVHGILMTTGVPVVEGVDNARDFAIELLRIAAEAEHALMVQYLYTAASIPSTGSTNFHRKILNVAIEEMGHLASLQNVLFLLGGRDALHMQRDVMRRESDQNPLPFVLEPISRAALAKYVAVEMPATVPDDLRAKVDELVALAKQDAGAEPHRVGAIYALLLIMFSPPDPNTDPDILAKLPADPYIKESDLQGLGEIDRYAAGDEWEPKPGMILKTARTVEQAYTLLEEVATQGEGLPSMGEETHFSEFLALVDAFDKDEIPSIPLAKAPALGPDHGSEKPEIITHPYTKLWGEVFSLQYTAVVLTIYHALVTPRPLSEDEPDRRAAMAALALRSMRTILEPLAVVLAGLPLKDGGTAPAGPPYDFDPAVLESNEEQRLVEKHIQSLDRLAALYEEIKPKATSQQKDTVQLLVLFDRRRRNLIKPPQA